MLETAWESRWLPVQKKQQKADDIETGIYQ